MSSKDGGHAFPQALGREAGFVGDDGMSLRDYFAGQALPGVLMVIASMETSGKTLSKDHDLLAGDMSYQYADAMLKARGA